MLQLGKWFTGNRVYLTGPTSLRTIQQGRSRHSGHSGFGRCTFWKLNFDLYVCAVRPRPQIRSINMYVCARACVRVRVDTPLAEEDTQSWGGTWHNFAPNPTTISIGMALEGGGGHVPLVPPCFCHLCACVVHTHLSVLEMLSHVQRCLQIKFLYCSPSVS